MLFDNWNFIDLLGHNFVSSYFVSLYMVDNSFICNFFCGDVNSSVRVNFKIPFTWNSSWAMMIPQYKYNKMALIFDYDNETEIRIRKYCYNRHVPVALFFFKRNLFVK